MAQPVLSPIIIVGLVFVGLALSFLNFFAKSLIKEIVM